MRHLSALSQTPHFQQVGQSFVRLLIQTTGLQRNERVLEVGCGLGRIAIPLAEYLTEGTYEGFDILEGEIKWAQKNISSKHPHFHFQHVTLYNKYYSVTEQVKAANFRFPYPDNHFDVVYLCSVFTHMLREDMEHYQSEIARVLKPGGRYLSTYFLLTPLRYEKGGLEHFPYLANGCRLRSEEFPEWEVAYEEKDIRELYVKNGLLIKEVQSYEGREGGHDVIYAVKQSP
jgi:SAM-dependent methyltransferase